LRRLAPPAALLLALHAPGSGHTYTTEQAAAGRAAYAQYCAACHGETLRQLPDALLGGREFVAEWGTRGTHELVIQLAAAMPPDNPGGLADDVYLAITAYLLEANGGSANGSALTAATTALVGAGLSNRAQAAAATRTGGDTAAAAATGVTVTGTVEHFVPVTDELLRNPDPADWLMLRRDFSATSYSPLDEITAANADELQLEWVWPMRDGGTNQPAPLAYGGVLYLANTGGIVQALDAKTGKLIWEHSVGAEIAPRGLALYDDMLIFHSAAAWAITKQEARMVALDARTGETVWDVVMPDVYATNSGPIVADGLLLQGMGT
jgi:mono/diheme cytochrome c family protein